MCAPISVRDAGETPPKALRAIWLLAVVAFAGGALPGAADSLFETYAGAGSWLQDYHGRVMSGITEVDVEDDLALGDEENNVFYLAMEHAVPVLPHVRLVYTKFDAEERTTLVRSIDFNGVIFPGGTDIETLVDMTQGDAVFYYEAFDETLSIDLGLATRYVDGDMEIMSVDGSSRAEFAAWLPLGYARARFDVPFTRLWLGLEGAGVGYDGESLLDANVELGWKSPHGVGFEVGYRWYRLELAEHGDLDEAKIDVEGPFASLNVHF
jgi:outer membrane protein